MSSEHNLQDKPSQPGCIAPAFLSWLSDVPGSILRNQLLFGSGRPLPELEGSKRNPFDRGHDRCTIRFGRDFEGFVNSAVVIFGGTAILSFTAAVILSHGHPLLTRSLGCTMLSDYVSGALMAIALVTVSIALCFLALAWRRPDFGPLVFVILAIWLFSNAFDGWLVPAAPGSVPVLQRKALVFVVLDDADSLKRMLDEGVVSVTNQFRNGNFLLHHAAARNRTNVVQTLVQFGADPRQTNSFGVSVIKMAAKFENYDLARIIEQLTPVTNAHENHSIGHKP